MEEIQLTRFQEDIYNIINAVIHSHRPILISDKGKFLVKIVPVASSEQASWLGCMRGTGKIIGDIISPAEEPDAWEVLSS
jgi:prevent-host-death family protein